MAFLTLSFFFSASTSFNMEPGSHMWTEAMKQYQTNAMQLRDREIIFLNNVSLEKDNPP